MNEFIKELLDMLDQTTADPATKLSVLGLIQKHTGKDQEQQKQTPEDGVTKDGIMAIKDPVQRIQAIRLHSELFGAANTHNELENRFQD